MPVAKHVLVGEQSSHSWSLGNQPDSLLFFPEVELSIVTKFTANMKLDTPGVGRFLACPQTLCDLTFLPESQRDLESSTLHPYWLAAILSKKQMMPFLPIGHNPVSIKVYNTPRLFYQTPRARVPQLKCQNCCLGIAHKRHVAMTVILL